MKVVPDVDIVEVPGQVVVYAVVTSVTVYDVMSLTDGELLIPKDEAELVDPATLDCAATLLSVWLDDCKLEGAAVSEEAVDDSESSLLTLEVLYDIGNC